MKTISTTCPACRRKLSTPVKFANTTAPCPKCGAAVAVPPAGLGQSDFITYKLIQFVAFFVLAGFLRLPSLLLMPLMMAASVFICTARLEYLGMAKSNAIISVIPFVSFVQACVLAGASPIRSGQ